jgi:hypothetical protein
MPVAKRADSFVTASVDVLVAAPLQYLVDSHCCTNGICVESPEKDDLSDFMAPPSRAALLPACLESEATGCDICLYVRARSALVNESTTCCISAAAAAAAAATAVLVAAQ